MDLSIVVNGITFPNPFLLGSGPPGTNAALIAKSYDAGWGGAVAKTISLESAKVVNVVPRYGKLRSKVSGEVIGFENIELISDRPIDVWLDEFRQIKKDYPKHILIASIMEEFDKGRWQELTRMVQDTGVDAFELNFSCPHGMTERKMGSEMGEHPDLCEEVTGWVTEVSNIPVWAKMTPNITNIKEPSLAAVRGGAVGISAINYNSLGDWRGPQHASAHADSRRAHCARRLFFAGGASDRAQNGEPACVGVAAGRFHQRHRRH